MLTSKDAYHQGATVFWKWGRGKIKGTVQEVHFTVVEKQIKNTQIKRKASHENPAYFIKEDSKNKYVLKLHSELMD